MPSSDFEILKTLVLKGPSEGPTEKLCMGPTEKLSILKIKNLRFYLCKAWRFMQTMAEFKPV